jgi:hypothetical protein
MDDRIDRPITFLLARAFLHALNCTQDSHTASLTPPCSNYLKTDITSQTVTEHESKDADCILTAVLLASHLGGSAAAIQEWLGGFKECVRHLCSNTRAQLEAAFKLREGPQMDRVVTVAERLLGVELGEHAVPAYCVQISSDKYQKKVQKCCELHRSGAAPRRARHSSWLARRLVRHTSSVPGVNGPRKAFERGKAW